MKNYTLLIILVVGCAFGLMHNASRAQERSSAKQEPTQQEGVQQKRILTEAQIGAIVKPKLEDCSTQNSRIEPASIIPSSNARAFPATRIAKTLHGIWLGHVLGDDKDLSVDYFWIVDTKNNEGLIIALRNGKQSVAAPREAVAATAPKLTFLMCPHEGYIPSKQTPMIHEFVKVSDSIANAPEIIRKATGVKVSKARPSLTTLWQELLAAKYFNSMPAVAFAGALFKPIQIGSVANAVGPAGTSLKWNAEYRGGGSTSIQYTTGVPMVGVEHAEFVGTSTQQGDYLVSSPGNGKIWKVEADSKTGARNPAPAGKMERVRIGHNYDLAFDKVVLGPLK
jgi:hypothetical protein